MNTLYTTIIDPIAWLLGKVLDVLFTGLHSVGLGNTAIAIIVFTFLVKLLMLPLTFKQAKMVKLSAVMNPEIKEIQKKYKDKHGDQNAMMKMQEETKAVYEKYGTSQMGGCIQMLIQFPILMALYRVIQYIPMYISQLKVLFVNILSGTNGGIMSVSGYSDIMKNNFSTSVDWSNTDAAIKAMNSFTPSQWETLKTQFPVFSDVITANQGRITEMNTFLTVNVSQNPTLSLSVAVLIPILAGLSQFVSVKISQSQTMMDDDNPAAASMKMMTLFMPLMSVFMAFSLPAGLGVYWIATAVFQTIMQLMVNRHYDKVGVDVIVSMNVKKMQKKRAKKGAPKNSILKNAALNTKSVDSASGDQKKIQTLKEKKEANDKKMKELLNSADSSKTAKPGSLAEKAGMVTRYNDKSDKKNKK